MLRAAIGLCVIGLLAVAAGAPLATPVAAAGQALNFDGVDDQVTLPDRDAFSPSVNDLSLSLWAKVPASSPAVGDGACTRGGRYVVVKGFTDQWEWGLEFDKNTKVCFSTWQLNSNTHGGVEITKTVNDDRWHHYAVTLDYKVRLLLYIDGVQVASRTSFSKDMANGTRSVLVGARADGNRFLGQIDELRLYNRVLTAAEITAHYNGGLGQHGVAEAGLAGGWHLDEGSGASAGDYSGGGAQGSISGATWVTGLISPPGGGSGSLGVTISTPSDGAIFGR
jgi:hypothetical protein